MIRLRKSIDFGDHVGRLEETMKREVVGVPCSDGETLSCGSAGGDEDLTTGSWAVGGDDGCGGGSLQFRTP